MSQSGVAHTPAITKRAGTSRSGTAASSGVAPLSLIQSANSGASSVPSGTAWNLGQNPAAGNAVLMLVNGPVGSQNVSSVTGLGATWNAVQAKISEGGGDSLRWFLGTGCSGSTKAITVNGVNYQAAAFEVSGVVSVSDGGNAGTTSISPALTVSGLASGYMVFVSMSNDAAGTLSAAPTSPWTVYTGGWLTSNNGQEIAYQTTTSPAAQTATWAQGSHAWQALGAVLIP